MLSIFETLFISVIGGLAAGLAGIVTFSIKEKWSENRKVIRCAIIEAEKTLLLCQQESETVWNSKGGTKNLAAQQVVSSLHDLAEIINFIKDDGYPVELYFNSQLLNFRRATTGGDFDVAGREPQPDRTLEIRRTAFLLKISFWRTIQSSNRLIK